jgi:ribosomal protein L3 glutamine methyltransferase
MGCGGGILSILASSRGLSTVFVDREPRALELTRRNLGLNGRKSLLLLSDLFQGIPASYHGWADLITFNPPYLPYNGVRLERRDDMALAGGENGWELAFRFLETAPLFLAPQGRLFLLGYYGWPLEDLEKESPTHLSFTVVDERDIGEEKMLVWMLERKNEYS